MKDSIIEKRTGNQLSWVGKSFIAFLIIVFMPAHLSAQNRGEGTWRLKVACWNIQNFASQTYQPNGGRGKLTRDSTHYARIVAKINRYDIVFLQELLDQAVVTQELANDHRLSGYSHFVSEARGQGGQREFYGVFYRNDPNLTVTIQDFMNMNPGANPPVQKQVQNLSGNTVNAQDVWVRPPIVATVRYRLLNNHIFLFKAFTLHTAIDYNIHNLPPGVPANLGPRFSRQRQLKDRVYDELTSLETEVNATALLPGEGVMVIGDLNTDGANYPNTFYGQNFDCSNNWTWFPGGFTDSVYCENPLINPWQRTKRDAETALDRAILDDALMTRRKGFDVDKVYPQQTRVSDHYLIAVTFGNDDPENRDPFIVGNVPVRIGSSIKKSGAKRKAASNSKNVIPQKKAAKVSGSRMPAGITRANLLITKHNPLQHFKSNLPDALTDVRPGGPNIITTINAGSFSLPDAWPTPVKGAYNIVFDNPTNNKYGKYIYDKNGGDFTNFDNDIDLLVIDESQFHSDVVSLDDNGNEREIFNTDTANHIYGLARGLLPNRPVDFYVISMKLLPEFFTTWDDLLKSTDHSLKPLEQFAVPVNILQGIIKLENLKPEDKRYTVTTTDEGLAFTDIWPEPSNLAGTLVITGPVQPVQASDYDNIGPNDTCEDAIMSDNESLRRICGIDPNIETFTEYYGKRFAIIVDVNQNGKFDIGDKVDSHESAALSAYFETNDLLNEYAPVEAVRAYQQFLNERLLPEGKEISENGVYDAATKAASDEYQGQIYLSKNSFKLLTQDMQTSFVLLPSKEYIENKKFGNGIFRFKQVVIRNFETDPVNGPTRIFATDCLFEDFKINAPDLSSLLKPLSGVPFFVFRKKGYSLNR